MIDWQRVNDLKEEIGPDNFEDIVSLFLDEVEEVIQRLKTVPNPATLEADLHFLKGGAMNLGFHAFSLLCQAGENTAAKGRAKSVDVPEILQSFVDSKTEFLSADTT